VFEGSSVTDHPSIDELAEAAEQLLEPARAAEVSAHLTGCAACRDSAEALAEVTAILRSEPVPTMPAAVAERLDRVVAAEQDRRGGRRALGLVSSAGSSRSARATLGRFGQDLPRSARRRIVVPALAAAAAAAVVGFGAYVVSAQAGLNEPPPVAAISLSNLGAQAGALEHAANLSPHRFSQAWQCARQVTSGRITGLASTTVDGAAALLVYMTGNGMDRVTVVTGCNTGRPVAGQSVVLN
jgi:anti-sigma factor RsiW